jgi:hypothetical protein
VIRRAAAGALVALAALGASGCAIPAGLRTFVNQGAELHAHEHVAAGDRTAPVLCAIGEDYPQGWLIPSDAVDAFGCSDAWRRATGVECHHVGGDDGPVSCSVLGVWWGALDGNPYLVQAPVATPARLG